MTTPHLDTPAHTGSSSTRWLGLATLAGMAVVFVLGFWAVPEDDLMRDGVRLMFVHVPAAIMTYVAFVTTAVGSVMWLWKRSVWWDITAHAAAEIGVLFCALMLITGSIWGRPFWNTYWEWGDVRLVTSLILFVMMVGYLAVRSMGGDESSNSTRAAIVGLVAAVNLPIINRSVEWWADRTLHQRSSLTDGNLEDMTLFTLMLGLVVWLAFFVWAMVHRFRIGWLERELRVGGLDEAIATRRAEAVGTGGDA